MHLSRILDQIKRHPSPTEALTKLGKAMDKHEDNLLEKGFRILKSELCANVYEARHTPAEASASLPVVISTTGSVSPAANSKSVPVVKSDSTPLVGSEIQAGNRYWIYYNKCDNVMQVMNHYPAATA